MAYKRFEQLTGGACAPGETWLYVCDGEGDLTTVPEDCAAVIVAAPAAGSGKLRVRGTDGTFVEV